jgi:hypothetical protein
MEKIEKIEKVEEVEKGFTTIVIYKGGQCGNYVSSNIARFILKDGSTEFRTERNEYIHILKNVAGSDNSVGNTIKTTHVRPRHFISLMNHEITVQSYKSMLEHLKQYKSIVIINNIWNIGYSDTLGLIKNKPDDFILDAAIDQILNASIDEHYINIRRHYLHLYNKLKRNGYNVFYIDFKDLLVDKSIETYKDLCNFYNTEYSVEGYNDLVRYVNNNTELLKSYGINMDQLYNDPNNP